AHEVFFIPGLGDISLDAEHPWAVLEVIAGMHAEEAAVKFLVEDAAEVGIGRDISAMGTEIEASPVVNHWDRSGNWLVRNDCVGCDVGRRGCGERGTGE